MSSTVSTPHQDNQALLHQTAVALSQVQNLLRQATDIMAHLHTHFLHHIRQADPTFRQHFQQLPPPPTYSINLPSPTSSCDSAPSRPRVSPTTTTIQQFRRHTFTPPQLHNLQRPVSENSHHHHHHSTHKQTGTHGTATPIVACSTSWLLRRAMSGPMERTTGPTAFTRRNNSPPSHHKRIHNNRKLPPPTHIPPTPTSPAGSPPPPSQPDFSPSPMTTPLTSPAKSPTADVLPLPAAERAPSENSHPEKSPNAPIGSYFT